MTTAIWNIVWRTEPSPGFFKATCLFDPIDPETPKRMQALVQRNPGRIVALRIHEIHPAGTPSTTTGVIRDRDLLKIPDGRDLAGGAPFGTGYSDTLHSPLRSADRRTGGKVSRDANRSGSPCSPGTGAHPRNTIKSSCWPSYRRCI